MKGWRQGVQTYLAAQINADVVAGERDGVHRGDKDLIAVWLPGWDELQRDIAIAVPTLLIRYFPTRSKQPAEDAPADPSPLEDAVDTLIAKLGRPTQGVGFFTANLSCRLASAKPNYASDIWRVDASLIAYTLGAAG